MTPRLALAGQIGVVALLVAALWDPAAPLQRAPLHLVVLLDESASMTRAAADAAWKVLAPALAGAGTESRVSVVRFARESAVELQDLPATDPSLAEPPPARHPLSDRQTDVASAVQTGLGIGLGERSPVLILVSDGMPTLGDTATALQTAAAARVPVLWWRPPAPAQGPDAWIARLSAPPRVGPAEPVPLTAVIGADGSMMADVVVLSENRPLLRRSVALGAGRPLALELVVDPAGTGSHELTAELQIADRIPENNRRTVLVEREGLAPVALVSPRAEGSSVAASLRAGGWPLVTARPATFSPAILDGAGVLVLEELAAGDLAEADWSAIERAVRDGGLGLIVLGGPGTFAAGGYRHSTLESLLPVLAEAPRPQPSAAIVFAVDTSGSMGQPTTIGATRLALAGRAIAASARSLSRSDSAALIAFDVEARTLLPLAPRHDQPAALESALRVPASGGTQIGPALERALDLLGSSGAEDRLLVVATDGRFTDADAASRLAPRFVADNVDVVAIAVGAEANVEALEPLAAHGRSRVLRAADAIELPALMERAVQGRRNPVRLGPVVPRTLRPLPFRSELADWPSLAALQVTRARPGAAVYLATDEGEPVLAEAFRGAGRVVALPAGLGSWTDAWKAWPDWGRFLGGLVQWVAARGDPSVDLRVDDRPSSIGVTLDVVGDGGDWAAAQTMPVAVRDPGGAWHRLEARPQGPGRWAVDVESGLPGRYDVVAGPPGVEQRRALVHDPIQELVPGDGGRDDLEALAARGLVATWSPTETIAAPPAATGMRRPLVASAVALFALVLAGERLPPQALPRWLRHSRRREDEN